MYWNILLLPAAISAASLVSVDELKPQVRSNARRTMSKFGPYTIPASSGGSWLDSTSWGSPFFGHITKGLCNNLGNGKDPKQDCTLLAGRVGVMWADGSNKGRIADPSTGIYIHHILSSNTHKAEKPWFSMCGTPWLPTMNVNGITGGSGFLSTGEDSAAEQSRWTDSRNTYDTGYHLKANDEFNYWAQVVNYNKEAAKIYVTFDTEWLPGIVGRNAQTTVVSATCGGGFIKMSGSGSTNTTSGKFYIMQDGRILGARGHIHDGGVGMHMFINDKYTCTSTAQYGVRNEGAEMSGKKHGHGGGKAMMVKRQTELLTVASMSDCVGPIDVKKGDSVVIKAEYNLKKHPLRVSASGAKQADVMGMMGILFTPGLEPLKKLDGSTM